MSLSVFSDEHFMKLAFQEAQKAFEMDEVPVGAVVVFNNQVIAKAHNMTEALNDVTAHAEMQAFTMAANFQAIVALLLIRLWVKVISDLSIGK
jgi:tRNA(adenine34) deaminase